MSEEEKIDPLNIKVINRLKGFLNLVEEEFSSFCNLLKNTGSIIAGGSILGWWSDTFSSDDIDIYANANGARLLYDFFDNAYGINDITSLNIAPAYDESFFRANNISSRIFFKLPVKSRSVDLMVVDDSTTVIDVVENFDLSFCKIFFDGELVYTTGENILQHINERSGYLADSYVPSLLKINKFIVNRIKKYKQRGFSIKYNINSSEDADCIKNIDVKHTKTPVSMEEWLVKKIYKDLLTFIKHHILTMDTMKIYLNYFRLNNYTFDSLLEMIRNNSSWIIPGWIRYYYPENKHITIFLVVGSLQYFYPKPFSIVPESYGDYLRNFMINVMEIENEDEFDKIQDKFRVNRRKFYNKVILSEYYSKLTNLSLLKKELKQRKTMNLKIRRDSGNRRIEELHNFVSPSDIRYVIYPEKEIIESSQGCQDILTQGIYNINAYLKGEAVEGYDISTGERDDSLDLEPVSQEESRDRLVFFLSIKKDELDLQPYCYSLEQLENDVKTLLYSTTCEGDSMRNIVSGLNDPIIRLDFGTRVYLKLSDLLGALYKTKKQVFVLQPTDTVFERTASFETTMGGSYVSADHCQDGSDKRLYNIMACEGNGDDLCYPVTESIQTIGDYDVSNIDQAKWNTIKSYYKLNFDITRLENEAQYLYDQLGGNVTYSEDDDQGDDDYGDEQKEDFY